jgi:hypothetical protein
MSREINHTERSETWSPTDDTKKFSEDALGLGPRQAGPFVIGLVDSIAGEGGVEVREFVATKHELLVLARHWATEIIDLGFAYFLYGCTGSSEWRTRVYADRRLSTIAKAIGEEEVRNAFTQAEQAFAKGVDQQAWRIFTEGTQEEQERFQQEVQENLARADETRSRSDL